MTVRYVIDSSVLISFERNQPQDIWPTLWANFEELRRHGEAMVPQEAVVELERGTDDLCDWVKHTGAVYPTDGDVLTVVAAITSAHPGWVQQTQNAADPFVIATAKVLGATAVTNETRGGRATGDKNLKIPQVAAEFSVATMTTNELFRQLGWRF